MKFQIAPSILSFNPADFATPVRKLSEEGIDWLHLDVMDGQFVPPITFGADLAASLKDICSAPLEAHLMTETPEAHFDAFARAGCERIIFHTEATHHAHRLCGQLRSMGVSPGVAINPATPFESLLPLLDVADLLLVMTVNPGWGGQSFIQSCLAKVAALRAVAPHLDIEVDGGIDPTTIQSAWAAGANVFVTGSYLTKAPSLAEGLRILRSTCAV